MKITFLTLTISRFDLLQRLMESVHNQTRQADEIILIDNSNGKLDNYYKANKVITANNLGVAQSLNRGLDMADPEGLLIISNDDNRLYPEAFEAFHDLARTHINHAFFSSKTDNFSCYALRPKLAINSVGYFDEMFYPYAYEDNDYYRRIKLQNLYFIKTVNPVFEMGLDNKPSQTMQGENTPKEIKTLIQQCYEGNRLRYIAKWGGPPQQEIFNIPFNMIQNEYNNNNEL